jgi:hypothetical protein
VRGDIVDKVQADVTNEVLPKLALMGRRCPMGIASRRAERSRKASGKQRAVAVFPVMALATLALPMIQLQSFSRPAPVFITAAGLIGATAALPSAIGLASSPSRLIALPVIMRNMGSWSIRSTTISPPVIACAIIDATWTRGP